MVITGDILARDVTMSRSESTIAEEIKLLLEEMQAAQMAFAAAYEKASGLVYGLPEDGRKGALMDLVMANEESFERRDGLERLVGCEGLDSTFGSVEDYYIELPFMDPYDCFEEPEPANAYPVVPQSDEVSAPLRGLFALDPEAVAGSGRTPDIEIEYLPGGGYRMSSIPRGQRREKGLGFVPGAGRLTALGEDRCADWGDAGSGGGLSS